MKIECSNHPKCEYPELCSAFISCQYPGEVPPSVHAEHERRTRGGEPTDDSNPKDRYGDKKPPLRLNPASALLYMARVFGLGAKKYGPYNWRTNKVRQSVYLEAAMRHILQALDGDDVDAESGQPHEAHAMACMAIILDAKSTGNLIDDRPTKGAASRVITELTEA